MGFDGWTLASMGSLMSSLSTRAMRLATVQIATLAVPLSTALQVPAAGRPAPLKPGVRQAAAIVMADIRLLRRQRDVPRQPRGGARRRGLGGRWSSTTGTLVSATASSARRSAPGRNSVTTRRAATCAAPPGGGCQPHRRAGLQLQRWRRCHWPAPTPWPSQRCQPRDWFLGHLGPARQGRRIAGTARRRRESCLVGS
jgi:hypothetical protein